MGKLNKNVIRLKNIKVLRNFNYITNICDGLFLILNSKKIIGEILNIRSKEVLSIKDMVNLLEKILNKKIKIINELKRIRPLKSEVQKLSHQLINC